MSDIWEEIPSEIFGSRWGTDFFVKTVLGHTYADVIRELAQNEFDAHGRRMSIELGENSLVVKGQGDVIDPDGWHRLSVIFGTGDVAGTNEHVEAKRNGIGSMNFGMRSLFLFGDHIRIASGGKRTELRFPDRAPAHPLSHDPSLNTAGVVIEVPYRTKDGALPAFDIQREQEALDDAGREFATTFMKLARPRVSKSLNEVVITSARLGCELQWRQSVQIDPRGTGMLRRRVEIRQTGFSANTFPDSLSEVEFGRTIKVPSRLSGQSFPDYYRERDGIRVGVSFPTDGGRLIINSSGIYSYPLGVSRAFTGYGFSLNAPFEMYPDRTRLLPLENSDWNAWLIDELAEIAVGLLPRELFRIYKADAYETFRTSTAGAHVPGLVERVEKLLRNALCWPSASWRQGATSLVASELLFADDRTIRRLVQQELSLDKQLHPDLANRESTREMAAKNGAVRFSVNSLIRLRSFTESYVPKTPTSDGEYNRRYVQFAPHMRQPHVQQRFAKALDGLKSIQLSKENRLDLEQAPATLSAAGTLVPARDLVIVPRELLRIASPESTLHSSLTGSKMIASLCKTLGTSGWVIHMADRVRGGTASDVERESFAAYLRTSPQLSERAWAAVRRSPVLRDGCGEWSAPSTWVHPSTPGAKRYFSGAVRFPAALTPAMLVGRLCLRKKLSGSDIVALAQRVAEGAVDPGAMIEALRFASQRRSLLGAATLKELSTKQFLLFGDRLLAPSETYLDDERLRELLGTDVCFVTQVPGPLARLLGCRAEPSLADVLKHIESLRQSGVGPRHPDALHAQMIECARREHVDPSELAARTVLWNQERGWEAPSDCLVGDDWRDLFRGAVTVLSDSRSIRWASIGVAQRPAERHWIRYFAKLSEAHATRGVSSRERALLLQAYRSAEGFPFNLPADCLSLLTHNGLLRPLGERLTGTFVVNDIPMLALALREAGVSISFAEPSARAFFESIGVKRLSHVAKTPRIDLGNAVHPREALHLQTYLGRVANPDFGKALGAVVVELDPLGGLGEEKVRSAILRFGHVEVVTDIREVWNVFGTEISSSAQSHCGPEAVYLSNPSNSRQCLRRLAQALADMVVPHGQSISAYIESLLLCRSRREIEEELSGWQIPWPTDWESADAEAPEEQDDNDETIFDLVEDSTRRLFRGSAPDPQSPALGSASPISSPSTQRSREFPDPSTVTLSEVRLGQASERGTGVAGGRARSSPARGTPRTPEEVALDTTLGHNAERWVYDLEQERVATLGLSPDEVVWVSAAAPLSDHDLCSPGVDGSPVFVEVKATVGRDGVFVWTASEFRRAMRARDHYLLYRVFDAASLNPKFARVWDPISGLEAQTIQLEVERLVIDIGPMVSDELDE